MRKGQVSLVATLLLFAVAGCNRSNTSDDKLKIAIAQFIDHPGLDDARRGFTEAIESHGPINGRNVRIDVLNAHGDNNASNTIANKVLSDNYDLILTLATPISQAVKARANNSKTPIIYGVITDPVSAGLVESMSRPGGNNTASSDQWPYFKQMQLLREYFPKYQRVGILYNPGEANSEYAVKQTQMGADSLKLSVTKKALFNTVDATIVTESFGKSVDIIYIPADNTAMTAAPSIIKTARKLGIPVLAGDPGTFQVGAMIGLGVSYRDLGNETAKLALRILKGEAAGGLSVAVVEKPILMVNRRVAAELGVDLPAALISRADTVVGR